MNCDSCDAPKNSFSAAEIGLLPHELSLYVGRDRGEKTIALPFIGANAESAAALFADRKGVQRLAVFAHKRCAELHSVDAHGHMPAVVSAVERVVAQLPEATTGARVFF